MLDPLRLQILAEFREPDSTARVARALGLPRQRVGYHVRALERAGLLRFVAERRAGTCVERVLEASATSYVVGPRALGALGPRKETLGDRFSNASLIAAASRSIDEVAVLRDRARTVGRQLPTLTIDTTVRFGSPEAQRAFAAELAESFATLVAKYHDDHTPRGRRFRVVFTGHPTLPEAEHAVPDTPST